MSDMTGATDNLAQGDPNLQLIERGGTELTPQFVQAFRAMSPEQQNIWVEDARRNVLASEYGWAASFLEDPELGPILREAAQRRWSDQRLLTELRKTTWFTSRAPKERQWDQAIALDPKSKDKDIEQQMIGIQEVLAQYNEVLTPEQIRDLAINSLRSGWSDQQLFRGIAAETMKGGPQQGTVRFGVVGRTVRDLASRFAVPLSAQAMDSYAQQIATGAIVQADYENILRNQAKSLYPSLSAEIDRGLDVATITDPYRQVAASTLGISAEMVNFADPKWNSALNFDDGKGRRMMTLYEWGRHLRTNEEYGYDRTPQARDKAYNMVDRLGRMFGVTA